MPKIRVGRLHNAEPIYLKRGARVIIDVTPGVIGRVRDDGVVHIGTGYEKLANDVSDGERVLLDDGNLEVRVERDRPHRTSPWRFGIARQLRNQCPGHPGTEVVGQALFQSSHSQA